MRGGGGELVFVLVIILCAARSGTAPPSPRPLRQAYRAAAGAIKNCCFAAEEDGTLDHILGEAVAMGVLLDVLCGVPSKEPDEAVSLAVMPCAAAAPAVSAIFMSYRVGMRTLG